MREQKHLPFSSPFFQFNKFVQIVIYFLSLDLVRSFRLQNETNILPTFAKIFFLKSPSQWSSGSQPYLIRDTLARL